MTAICAQRTGSCRRRRWPAALAALSGVVLASCWQRCSRVLSAASLLFVLLAQSPLRLAANDAESLPVSQTAALVQYISTSPVVDREEDHSQAQALGQCISFKSWTPPRQVEMPDVAPPERLPAVSDAPTVVTPEVTSPRAQSVVALSQFIFAPVKHNAPPSRPPVAQAALIVAEDVKQPVQSDNGDAESYVWLDYRQRPDSDHATGAPHLLVTLAQPLTEDELLKTLEEKQQGEAAGQESLEPIYADLKPIGAVSVAIQASPGLLPTNFAAERFKEESAGRAWAEVVFSWEAPALCHNPLYFEEANVERYGYRTPFFQPVVSAANFFTHVPALPYLMGAERPRDCIYTLGYYRPGSYVPYRIQRVPLSVRGGLAEAGVLTGLFYLLP